MPDDPGIILLVLMVVGSLILLPFMGRGDRKQTAELQARLHEFALQVGGTEYHADQPARPSFGHFPQSLRENPDKPFFYAVEFKHRGFKVLAYEYRRAGKDPKGRSVLQYSATVEIPIAPCPLLWIGHKWATDLMYRHIVPGLAINKFHRRVVVAAHDQQFARSVVDLELLTWIYERFGMPVGPIVLEKGVMHARTIKGVRLEPEAIIPTADAMIDLLAKLPPELNPNNSR
ncbi:hypothetical protein [Saccharomonospora glauca]|jgi:hypothetical protein|uniref:Uncharacterized protein n=1 Tax=Saccharomonospora glauca K62 TaxID=928724 RepID=I1CXH9_9PSEU|nr:hypothetical protein [Saccharomonospora glauca]EIE97403.1 hypothetical protein SacglDRAFT_00452 [Saccharomonospora glauca K62]